MDTCLLFSVDLLSVIWCPQCLTAICDLRGKCSCSWPRNASVYPTLLLPAPHGSVFHMAHSWDVSFGTAASLLSTEGAVLWTLCFLQVQMSLLQFSIKTPVFALVKGGVDGGVMSGPELIHGPAFKSGSFCIKVVTEAGLTNKNL